MKQTYIRILCWLTLLLSWMTISPLFIYLGSRWKLIGKRIRIFLFLISPFMLMFYLIIFLFALQGYIDYERKHRFANNEDIERITGVVFPELRIVEYKKGRVSFNGDYCDNKTLEMEEDLSESTYHYLDSISNSANTNWRKRDDVYIFDIMWGNGFPAPEGEDEEDDGTLYLSFKKGSKIINLSCGAW